MNTLPKKCDFLKAIINWVDKQFRGVEDMTDGWDSYLQVVLKDYVSTYEPPSELWAEIKTKVQKEVAINQLQSNLS